MRVRKLALQVGLFFLAWNSAASGAPIEWTVASGGNGHFYEAVDLATQISWHDAKALAEAAGGHLATITSAAEDAWVTVNLLTLVSGSGGSNRLGPWIGGYQDMASPSYSEPSGGWTWISGEPWSYTNWGSSAGTIGEPNNNPAPENYLHYYVTGTGTYSGWNDLGDFDTGNPVDSYLIEYDTNPIPEPSTALLLGLGLIGFAVRGRRV